MMRNIWITIVAATVLLAACKDKKGKGTADVPAGGDTVVNMDELPDSLRWKAHIDSLTQVTLLNKDSVLTTMTREVFDFIKNKNYASLDSVVHPELGLRFSPYATVDAAGDRKVKKGELPGLLGSQKKYLWGSYDGSGDQILLTPSEYFKKFVYDGNFQHPQKFDVNKFIGSGNSLNNLKDIYKEGDFTESYLSGTKKNGGLDWRTVRLVFQMHEGRYYLVGIVHDQWTI